MNTNLIIALTISSFVVLNIVYFVAIYLLLNRYGETIKKHLWAIDLGFIVLFGILIGLIIYLNSIMKNIFIDIKNYIVPSIIIISVLVLIISHHLFETRINK